MNSVLTAPPTDHHNQTLNQHEQDESRAGIREKVLEDIITATVNYVRDPSWEQRFRECIEEANFRGMTPDEAWVTALNEMTDLCCSEY
jgi:transcriptional/translational regulatory protein YebC/TACO1